MVLGCRKADAEALLEKVRLRDYLRECAREAQLA